MRIASISKSLTMVALAKLWEAGKLDLALPVQHYVPEFPEKEYEGEKVVTLSSFSHWYVTLCILESYFK